MRLLDTAGRRRGLAGSLGRELLTGGLATSGLALMDVSDDVLTRRVDQLTRPWGRQ